MTSDLLMARLRDATATQYEIVRELGRGGMAVVYLAYELALDRHVAIKALIARPDDDEGASRRFLREARTAARLSHPNVVRVYGVAPDGASVRYFTMQYVDGCSLDDLLRTCGRLPIPVACHVLAQIVDGLRYAHGHGRGGVVHRDVKPANVMLDSDGRVVLTDFGIARIAGTDTPERDAELLGTPEYMSPEQWTGDASTPASDQYSLGAVAYRMVAGVPPFEGAAFAAVQESLRATPRPLRALREDCPPLLEAIVARMLEKSPDARYASLDDVYRELLPLVPPPESVAELRELVARAASAAPPPAAPVDTPERSGRVTGAVADPTMQLPPPRRRGTRLRRALLPVGGVALAAGALAASLAPGRSGPATAPVAAAPRDPAPAPPARPAPPPTSAAAPSGAPVQIAEAAGETVASVGPPARVQLLGLPAAGRLRQGDSVRLRARVLDAHGSRVAAASVVLASSDSTRVAIRRHRGSSWAVARAAGGAPVRITARSGDVTARRSVRVVVGRVASADDGGESVRGPSDSGARSGAPPREAAVDAALDSLLAGLSARRGEALAGLRAADGDSESAWEFLTWAAGARRLRVKGSSREPPVFARGGATVDFAVVLTWHRGLRRDPARTARFRAAFVPDGRGWRLDHLQLREPFSPR